MVTGSGNVLPSVGTTGQTSTSPVVCVSSSTPGSTIASTNNTTNSSTNAAPTTEGLVPPLPRRPGENRRSNKPIMEKRRRARINNCLNELKTLILDAMKKDPARHSKLEKADILEMTVKHLETLQRQQSAMSAATDPAVLNKFRAGFTECAGEVGRFPGLDTPVRRRLLNHLSNCLNGTPIPTTNTVQSDVAPNSVQVHILPNPEPNSQQGIFFSTNSGGLQLVPTRLPNGDIALVLPQGSTTQFRSAISPAPSTCASSTSSSPLPMLIPIPQRTASSASASSTSTTCSSPVAFERLTVTSPLTQRDIGTSPGVSYETEEEYEESSYSQQDMEKPLALVMRKRTEEIRCEEEGPWRPW